MSQTCPSCKADAPLGVRWCAMCRTDLIGEGTLQLAPPAKRLGAFLLDVVIPMTGMAFLLIGTCGTMFATAGAGAEDAAGALGCGGFVGIGLIVLAYGSWALMLFAKGTTPGKKMLKLRVVKQDLSGATIGTMIVREWVGRLISGIGVGFGYIWILVDADNQGWHDKLASTYVVEDGR